MQQPRIKAMLRPKPVKCLLVVALGKLVIPDGGSADFAAFADEEVAGTETVRS